MNLGSVAQLQGNCGEALERYRQSYEVAQRFGGIRESAQVLHNLGRLLAANNDLAAAKRHFNEVIRIEPALPEPYFYLGLAHLYSGDPQSALEQQRILTRMNPEMADHLLGMIQGGGQP